MLILSGNLVITVYPFPVDKLAQTKLAEKARKEAHKAELADAKKKNDEVRLACVSFFSFQNFCFVIPKSMDTVSCRDCNTCLEECKCNRVAKTSDCSLINCSGSMQERAEVAKVYKAERAYNGGSKRAAKEARDVCSFLSIALCILHCFDHSGINKCRSFVKAELCSDKSKGRLLLEHFSKRWKIVAIHSFFIGIRLNEQEVKKEEHRAESAEMTCEHGVHKCR